MKYFVEAEFHDGSCDLIPIDDADNIMDATEQAMSIWIKSRPFPKKIKATECKAK